MPRGRIYYVGLCRPSDIWPGLEKDDGKTLDAYLCRDRDYLPCDLRWYLGGRVTTKTHWRRNAVAMLAFLNNELGTDFETLRVF
jgi:hypothetical protein